MSKLKSINNSLCLFLVLRKQSLKFYCQTTKSAVTSEWRSYCASTAMENGHRACKERNKRGKSAVETPDIVHVL